MEYEREKDSIIDWVRGKKWLDSANAKSMILPKLKNEMFGPTPPNVFVGEYGYPFVNAGPLISIDAETVTLDDPQEMYGLNYPGIIRARASLVRGLGKQHVRQKSSITENTSLIIKSQDPVDVEARFYRTPEFSMMFSKHTQPMGPSAEIKSLEIAGNPKIPRKVDALEEEGLKVRDALPELLTQNYSYYYLQKLLTAGILGEKTERRLVPTKWAITATDRMIADEYLESVKTHETINQPLIFTNEYLFNHFEILLLPGAWEFEQFESWIGGNIEHEYEPFTGRSDYAETEGGGYYAGRFATAEGLKNMRRQARVTAFREVGEDYSIPVGVWEVRENVRHALQNQPTKCADLKEALAILGQRLKQPMDKYLQKSRILTQKKLSEY